MQIQYSFKLIIGQHFEKITFVPLSTNDLRSSDKIIHQMDVSVDVWMNFDTHTYWCCLSTDCITVSWGQPQDSLPHQLDDAGFWSLVIPNIGLQYTIFNRLLTSSRAAASLAKTDACTWRLCTWHTSQTFADNMKCVCLLNKQRKSKFYLRVIEVDRCCRLEDRWCDNDSKHFEDRCHFCRAQSVLCKQRDNLNGPHCSAEGRTFQPATPPLRAGLREAKRLMCWAQSCSNGGGGGSCIYPQIIPSLWSHSGVTPPQTRWAFAASSLFPNEFHFPKVESHSAGCS